MYTAKKSAVKKSAVVKKSATKKRVSKKSAVASPIAVGNAVLIRCVTLYYTGRIVGLTDTEILIEDAAWIADTGRFAEALQSGQLNEVEPYPNGVVSIARGSVLDVSSWKHALPRVTR
jgi:hypothetical protein